MDNKFFRKRKINTKKNDDKITFSEKINCKDKITDNLQENINTLKKNLGQSDDIVIREFCIGQNKNMNAAIFYIDGLTDKIIIDDNVMKPLMLSTHFTPLQGIKKQKNLYNEIKNNLLTTTNVEETNDLENILNAILSGITVLFIDEYKKAIKLDERKWEGRKISEPPSSSVIRGPREGFCETLRTNITLIRRKIKSTKLTVKNLKLGQYTKTDIAIIYIKDIANLKIVEEIKTRLLKIQIDGVLDSGYIEQYIEDEHYTLFPIIGNTEKPDVVAAKLLEGRVAVFVDGSPIALTAPFLFFETLQSSEDYYMRPWHATFIRWIRMISLFIVLFAPAVYIAAQTYHREMLPTHLFITMAASKEGVPFPAYVEILIMSIIFEILKEAGVRMPRTIGQAISIVGALVLGQAAVDAGFVSNPAIMITALAGISGFVVYPLNDSITLLRFLLMFLGSFAGLFGTIIGGLFILVHIVSLRSIGIPYMYPVGPLTKGDLKDTLIRAPLWMINKRPRVVGLKNPNRN